MPNDLPQGLSFDPPAAMSPLPPGLSFELPEAKDPQLPEGMSFDNPAQPAKEPAVPEQKSNLEVPGFWSSVGQSFMQGMTNRFAADVQGAQVLTGLKPIAQAAQDLPPETHDEINTLLQRRVTEGWSDPKWWGAQIAHGAGGMVPAVGAVGVGSLVRVPAPLSFGAEAAIGTLVPAYRAATAAGLPPEDALKRAIIDTGIGTATAVAMGIAPGISLYGKIQNPAVVDQVAEMLKRPVAEALTQIGLVQPSLGVAGSAFTTLSHGEVPGGADLATEYVTNLGLGGMMVGAHTTVAKLDAARRAAKAVAIPPTPPASPETIQDAFQSQAPKGVQLGGQPAGAFDQPLEIQEPGPIFYSAVKDAIEKRVPDNASPDQILATLRNTPGVKKEELDYLNILSYLGAGGKVSKADLLAHVEANQVQLEEIQQGSGQAEHEALRAFDTEMKKKYGQYGIFQDMTSEELSHYEQLREAARRVKAPDYPTMVLPGEHSNYREFILKVPERGPRIVEDNPIYDPNYSVDGRNQPQRERVDPRLNFIDNSHWTGVVNALGHFRLTDRVDRDGVKMLHVEEIQSDLHQRGAKQGYLTPEEVAKAPSRDLDTIEKEYDTARDRLENYIQLRRNFPNIVRDMANGRDPNYNLLERRAAETRASFRAALAQRNKMPDLPFKTSWQELAVKRILRLAADEGYQRVSWSNGDQVGLRLNTPEQVAGARQNYDKTIPAIFKKWANKLGGTLGSTEMRGGPSESVEHAQSLRGAQARLERLASMDLTDENFNRKNYYVDVHPAMSSRIKVGLPLFDKDLELKPGTGRHTLSENLPEGAPQALRQAAKKIDQIIQKVSSEMKISRGITFNVGPLAEKWRGRLRDNLDPTTGHYIIDVNTNLIRTPQDLYASMSHEFGHVVEHNLFETAPHSEQIPIFKAFEEYRKKLETDMSIQEARALRDNPVSEVTGARDQHNTYRLSDLTSKSYEYFSSFSEWFAEQTAKWMTTNDRPLGIVEKFFKSLAAKVRKALVQFRQKFGLPGTPEQAVTDFLNSRFDKPVSLWAEGLKEQLDMDTQRANHAAMDRDGTPEVVATPQTASTGGGRNIVASLGAAAGSAGPAMAAHADRMNKFYEWMTSLPQIASVNRHIRGLQMYKEIVTTMNLEKNNIMGDAWQRLRQWKVIQDPKQLFGLNKFIEDYMNADFKLPHTQDGLYRRPHQDEFDALVRKHGLGDGAVKLFKGLQQDFDGFLEMYRKILLDEAGRIKDPIARQRAMDDANLKIDEKLKAPYFPAMRFGKYTITIYDHAGNIKHFEQTDSLRKQSQIVEALKKSSNLLPGDKVLPGELKKDTTPLLGMPPGLLDMIDRKLSLSVAQREALDQLRFDYAPAQSFKHQFRQRDITPGYSTDFQRAYAHFFFHGANHLTRVKWVDALRDQINSLDQDKLLRENANKISQIQNYMGEHLRMLVDPKPDFAALRGLMFHWYLGFNPASATLNLSQTPVMTFPHLASKFGDIHSVSAILKAGTDLKNFYKKGTIQEVGKSAPLGPTGSAERALAEAVKEGVISETQAHTLAAVSEDRNLLRAFGSKGEEAWQRFSEASSWMFEMAEQYNRRVAFRAAWELAMRDPNNRYVQEAVRDNPLQYSRLVRDRGWTHQEAAAFTAAKDSVEKTQFVYAPYNRPKFMWGRKGALFIFKSFTQNTLFSWWSNPQMAARSLLILGALGGLMGLPGTEDINGILKALAWRLFGKDFDLEDQARKFAVDVLNGTIGPDTLLHGMSAHGFGIPQVMHATGSLVGLDKKFFPTLDRSKSIGMGNILPFEPGKLFGPTKDVKGAELQQLQRASGAGFSNIFALYGFLNSQQSLSDLKRWEQIMPRAFSNLSHAWRYSAEGVERNKAGNAVVRFDVRDTEQAAEILARALGYQPRRLTAQWEAQSAKIEAATYWDLRKELLLRQFGEAVKAGNPDDRARVLEAIRKYNSDLPSEAKAKGITSETLKLSIRNRMMNKAKQEAGLPLQKQNIQMFREMDKYFPEGRPTGQTDARPVK